jgi:hypothetical protein
MSSSDRAAGRDPSPPPSRAADTSDDARAVVSALERLAHDGALSPESVRAVVSVATRLYAEASARAGQELPPLNPEISTTDALTLACALVRSQDLTPFEMAVWFSHGQRTE